MPCRSLSNVNPDMCQPRSLQLALDSLMLVFTMLSLPKGVSGLQCHVEARTSSNRGLGSWFWREVPADNVLGPLIEQASASVLSATSCSSCDGISVLSCLLNMFPLTAAMALVVNREPIMCCRQAACDARGLLLCLLYHHPATWIYSTKF